MESLDNIKNKANNIFRAVATPFIGVLKESKFLEQGLLTPDEYVLAGDQLVHKCPTWKWMPAEDKLANKNLPPAKQYLVTEKVPCLSRIADLEQKGEATVEKELDDGWVEAENPHIKSQKDKKPGETGEQEFVDIDDMQKKDEQMEDEQVKDIDDYDNDNETDNIFMNGGKYVARFEDESNIQKY